MILPNHCRSTRWTNKASAWNFCLMRNLQSASLTQTKTGIMNNRSRQKHSGRRTLAIIYLQKINTPAYWTSCRCFLFGWTKRGVTLIAFIPLFRKVIIAPFYFQRKPFDQSFSKLLPCNIIHSRKCGRRYLHLLRGFLLSKSFIICQTKGLILFEKQINSLRITQGCIKRLETSDEWRSENFSIFTGSRHKATLVYYNRFYLSPIYLFFFNLNGILLNMEEPFRLC